MKIAVPIVASGLKAALAEIAKANKVADVIELRIDYLKKGELNEATLKRLIAACKKPCIVTNRSRKEGGKFRGSESERIALLEKAISLGADFADVEFSSGEEVVKKIINEKRNTKIILSYHNFKRTPALAELSALMRNMAALKPDVVKIVCMAKRDEDNGKIMELLREAAKSKIKIIAFCMGEKGRKSRIISAASGAFLAYAALEKGKESASGQMTVEELKKSLNSH